MATASAVDGILDRLANAVVGEGDALAKELLQLGNNRLEAVFCVWLSVWSAKVGHEDDGFGAIVDGVLDCGKCADYALVVGDLLVGVQRDVEVDLEIVMVRCDL